MVQDNNLEIPTVAIIDGDTDELEDGEDNTTAVENAKKLEVAERVLVSPGTKTLEVDLFPSQDVNESYLKSCFVNLGHETSYNNLIKATKDSPELWEMELIKRIDQTIKKGRFAQELSLLIDEDFFVPEYIKNAIIHIADCKEIDL